MFHAAVVRCAFVTLLGMVVLLSGSAAAQSPVSVGGLDVVPIEKIKRADKETRLSPEEAQSRMFILKTAPHPTIGDAYVIVTDHADDGYGRAIERLAKHHSGSVIRLEDLTEIARDAQARDKLRNQLIAARPRYVAVAPRLASYRENLLLSMWEVLTSLDADPQLDALPGILIAPSEAAFAALVDRSINYQPRAAHDVRPLVIGQVGDDQSIMGQRSLQKVEILKKHFARYGLKTSSIITRVFPSPTAEKDEASDERWIVAAAGPRRFITALPAPAKQALDQSSVVLMFGHGVPGMTCSLDVKAFQNVTMNDNVVLCGSCFSAAPLESDFPAMRRGPGGMEIRNDRERFLMRTIENGAIVAYGHMRENSGFPHLYPVLESWIEGLSVGEGYQRLLNAIIDMDGFSPGQFILTAADTDNRRAVMRRTGLLYVIVGDPALVPLQRLTAIP